MTLLAVEPVITPATWDNCTIDGVPTMRCFEVLVERLLMALGGIIFIVLLVLFIYGSYEWMTAGDDAAKVKKAQAVFTSAVIGLVIISAGYLTLLALEQIFPGFKLTVFSIPTS